MLDHYNQDFKADSNYYNEYGCNCLGNLDRYAIGVGVTLDHIDRGCKMWHTCMKCAQEEYGDQCNSKNNNYRMDIVGGDVQCKNDPDSCKRAICECDKIYAINMGERK